MELVEAGNGVVKRVGMMIWVAMAIGVVVHERGHDVNGQLISVNAVSWWYKLMARWISQPVYGVCSDRSTITGPVINPFGRIGVDEMGNDGTKEGAI